MIRRAVLLALVLLVGMALVAAPAQARKKPRPSASPARIASTVQGCFNLSTDMGRPVCEIASALGVPAEVFREAFTHVTPAAKGSEPTEVQREANHQALLSRLAPYGVTPQLLDAVSDKYRL